MCRQHQYWILMDQLPQLIHNIISHIVSSIRLNMMLMD